MNVQKTEKRTQNSLTVKYPIQKLESGINRSKCMFPIGMCNGTNMPSALPIVSLRTGLFSSASSIAFLKLPFKSILSKSS